MTTNANIRQPDQPETDNLPPPARKRPAVVIALWRFVRRLRIFRYRVKGEWRLWWNLCPVCNSDAPRCDRCHTCTGSREFPLSAATKERYRHSYHNDYDVA